MIAGTLLLTAGVLVVSHLPLLFLVLVGVVVAGAVPVAGLQVAPRLEYRHRQRNAATTDYAVLDLRISRTFGRYELRVEGTNLGDAEYQEIAGVATPGRAGTVSLIVR